MKPIPFYNSTHTNEALPFYSSTHTNEAYTIIQDNIMQSKQD